MTTNENNDTLKVVTQIGVITSNANGTLFTAAADINLGNIPLAMNPAGVDNDGDHVADEIFNIEVNDTSIVVEFENPLDDDDGLVNVYEDDDNDGINNHDDDDDDDINALKNDLDGDGISNDVDDDNDGINDDVDTDDDNDGINDDVDSDDDNDGIDDDIEVNDDNVTP